tara:strand:+ start:299 stop:589 length:291 start_codon:yes stop_codon:yes gene_type:complete
LLLKYQKKFKKLPFLPSIFKIALYYQQSYKNILVKSDFDKSGTDAIGLHWAQYLSLTLSSLLIFFVSLYKTIPNFKNLILNIIWFLNCSGLNCNGA